MVNEMTDDGFDFILGGICGLILGGVLGLILAGQFNGKTIENKINNINKPIAIVYEDRNADNQLDLIQKFENGNEIVLYASRNAQGNIMYRL